MMPIVSTAEGLVGGDYEEVSTPTENDMLVSRLIARIAELEEKLYKKELEAPAVRVQPEQQPAPVPAPASAPRLRDTIFNTLKDSWAKLEAYQVNANAASALTPQPAVATTTFTPLYHDLQRQRQQGASGASAPGSGTRASIDRSPKAAHDGAGAAPAGPFPFKTQLVVNYDKPTQLHDDGDGGADDGTAARGGVAPEAGGPSSVALAAANPLPSASSSDGGAGGVGTSAGGASTPSVGASSRAADWFAKLSLPWGRDKQQQQEGAVGASGRDPPRPGQQQGHGSTADMSRDASSTNLLLIQPLGAESSFNEKALEERLAADGGQYYRYVFDPVDVQAEMEVTARVRRAAAEALMEANAKLAEAQQAQAALQRQLEEAKELAQVVDQLQAERSAMEEAKAQVEGDMMAMRSQLESMKGTETSLQTELEAMRAQSEIWRSSNNAEGEKLKQENQLLRNQLTTRLSELQTCRTRLGEGEAERQRMTRESEELLNKIQWLTKINLQLENAASQVDGLRKAAADWQERFMRERNVRRRLHDQLQQLKGNIRVLCRVRPAQQGQRDIVTYPLEGLLAVSPPDKRYQEFEFDHVFGPDAAQPAIFEEAVSPLVRSCADGYNVCIFAYGQTGSGKTHTMQGPTSDPGINVRALQELFRIANEEGSANVATPAASDGGEAPSGAAAGGLGRWSISVSLLEIYNEQVHDLLAGGADVAKPMDVSALGAGELPPGVDRVPGLTWTPVATTEQVERVLREGGRNRATAATALNAHSSRSHALLSVRVSCAQPDGRQVTSLMHLVDLAGSERVDKSEVTGAQLKEAQSINKSLSSLGDVIAALQRRSPHIPFRNSKLTTVLQDSLCGNSKVLLVCNISPEATSASETVSSLNFASRAAQVELGAARRAPASSASPTPERSPGPDTGARGVERPGGGSTPGPGPSSVPLPIMNGTAAKVRAHASMRASQASPAGLRS